MIDITTRPDYPIKAGNTSRWLALNADYPVIFKLFRKDYVVTLVENAGGNAQLTVTGDITSQLTIGIAFTFLLMCTVIRLALYRLSY